MTTNRVIKHELVREIQEVLELHGVNLTLKEVSKVIEVLPNAIVNILAEGKEVCISGLATFIPTIKEESIGRNPKTQETITIPKHRHVKIKKSRRFADNVKATYVD